MTRRPPTFYVLHGPDDFSRRAQLQTLRAQMGDPSMAELNTALFDGRTASVVDVLSAARALPFLSDKRLVIVDGMLIWLTRKGAGKSAKADLDTLGEGLKDLPDWARVVFVERETLPEKHPILVLARNEPGGFHKTFDPPRNPAQWITNHARTVYETPIDARAAAALAAVVGEDLHAADSELAKLAAFVDGERAITEADVVLLTPYAPEPNVFEMVDAMGRGDGKTALQLLHRLLEDGEPLSLFGMIIRQFRLLLLAREHLDAGGAPGQIAQAVGVPPFVAEKLAAQVRPFSIDQLEQIYRHLAETDLAIKTGRVDGVLALDLLMAGVSS